jgi:hypothetical protein
MVVEGIHTERGTILEYVITLVDKVLSFSKHIQVEKMLKLIFFYELQGSY